MALEQNHPSSSKNGFLNAAYSFSEEGDDSLTNFHRDRKKVSKDNNENISELPLPVSTEEDANDSCGWLGFRPKCLQRLRTARWLLFWMCWASTVQGLVVNGFINVSITTIEKRYNLRSASTGLISGSYDIGSVLCLIPVSYLGSRPGASKSRWLGWGLIIMGIGSFVFAIPHFASPPYEISNSNEDLSSSMFLCLKERNRSSSCEKVAQEWLSKFRYVFILGQILHGVGATPLYTLGVTYLDESVPLKMSSLYIGIYNTMAILGPAVGFILGGQLLNTYIDAPLDPKILGITKGSDQWLGAWWIGFLISGLMSIFLSWIIMAFPSEIPGAKERAAERISSNGGMDKSSVKIFGRIRDLPEAVKGLVKNLPFAFLSLAESAEGFLVAGFATFMPKFVENQFIVSAGFASIMFGLIAVPAGGGGTFFGGWLIKRFKMKTEKIMKFCCIVSSLCFFSIIFFVVSCPDTPFAGVNAGYEFRTKAPESPLLTSSCNENCGCENTHFDPVCGANKMLYFSPCHAGCRSSKNLEGNEIYTECQCILQQTNHNDSQGILLGSEMTQLPDDSAIRQKCPSTCKLLPFVVAFFFLSLFFTFLISIPSLSATLRCVPDSHRSLALGIQWIVIRLLGTIPGPIVLGIIIDRTCTLWQKTCEGFGACRNYNNSDMSRSILAVALCIKGFATILYFLTWWSYKRQIRNMKSPQLPPSPTRGVIKVLQPKMIIKQSLYPNITKIENS